MRWDVECVITRKLHMSSPRSRVVHCILGPLIEGLYYECYFILFPFHSPLYLKAFPQELTPLKKLRKSTLHYASRA